MGDNFLKEFGERAMQRRLELGLSQLDVAKKLGYKTRHTWATQAMECGMNEEARKRILGHASEGVTNKGYTHLDIELLKKEMEKLRY